jgi:hypothetical protein
MHPQWQDLMPFYLTGQLSQAEAAALENHLHGCADCRQALEEWRLIKEVVSAGARAWSRELPPLAAQVRASLHGAQPQAKSAPDGIRSREPRAKMLPSRSSRLWGAITVGAAAAAAIGLFVVYQMFLEGGSGTLEEQIDATQVAMLDLMATRTATTGFGAQPDDPPGDDLGILTLASPAPTLTLTPSPARTPVPTRPVMIGATGLPQGGGPGDSSLAPQPSPLPPTETFCRVIMPEAGVEIAVYEGPGETMIAALREIRFGAQMIAALRSLNGWLFVNYEDEVEFWSGWILPTGQEMLSGACDDLMVVDEVSPPITPTALHADLIGAAGFPLATLETIGAIPVNTRVQIGSAYYDGAAWRYQIVSQDGQVAEARPDQLAYVPGSVPTPTAP